MEQPWMCQCFWKSLHILRLHPGIVLLSKIEWDWTTPCSWLEKKKLLRSTQGSAGQHCLATIKQAESCFMLQGHAAWTIRTTNYGCFYTLYEHPSILMQIYIANLFIFKQSTLLVQCCFDTEKELLWIWQLSFNWSATHPLTARGRSTLVTHTEETVSPKSLALSPSLCAH